MSGFDYFHACIVHIVKNKKILRFHLKNDSGFKFICFVSFDPIKKQYRCRFDCFMYTQQWLFCEQKFSLERECFDYFVNVCSSHSLRLCEVFCTDFIEFKE